MAKKATKIPVLHYEEITDTTQIDGVELGAERYITNEGGKQYLVENLSLLKKGEHHGEQRVS